MNPKLLLYGAENRVKLLRGTNVFARTVCTTFGPHGQIVLIERSHGNIATKDGVTVAREVDLADPVENLACQILKTACITVNAKAGDGTTSTAAISSALIREGVRLAEGGHNPILLSRGILSAAQQAEKLITDFSVPAQDHATLRKVAEIATNGDTDVAENMATAVMAVGKYGSILIEDGNSVQTTLEYREGLRIDRGPGLSFLKGKTERVLENPIVAVIAAPLTTVEDVLDLCEEATTLGGRPLLLFAESLSGEALKTLLLNDTSKDHNFQFVAIPAPGNFDRKLEYLEDIASLADATVIDPRRGGQWKKWSATNFGILKSATLRESESDLLALDEASSGIRDRAQAIRNQLSITSSQYDRDRLQERLAALEGGLCLMKIGAYTENELKEKRARVEDELSAVQGALEEGLVPGGGVIYLSLFETLYNEETDDTCRLGFEILRKALKEPLRLLAERAGRNGDHIVESLLSHREEELNLWFGWNAKTESFEDFLAARSILDPAKVARHVVLAAASAASTLLTSEVSIVRKIREVHS